MGNKKGETSQDKRDFEQYGALKQGQPRELGLATQRWGLLYTATAVYDTAAGGDETDYFYRSMTVDEWMGWVSSRKFKQTSGHQGWADSRAYALKYMTQKNKYYRLVQVYNPKFREELLAHGWFKPKLESGALSWGIGKQQSNGFQKSGTRKKRLEAKHPYEIWHETLKASGSLTLVNLIVEV